jgi:BspA type Leucine rich repeat region (6 copies)
VSKSPSNKLSFAPTNAQSKTPSNKLSINTTTASSTFVCTNAALSLQNCCYGQSNVTLASDITAIPEFAPYQCSSLKSVTIPSTVVTIGYRAFHRTSLTSVIISNGAFDDCASLSLVTIGTSVSVIADGAFWSTAIRTILIPDSVVTIGIEVFSSCQFLSSITLGSSVRVLGDRAFLGTAVTSVTLPASITTVGANAFPATTSINRLTYQPTKRPTAAPSAPSAPSVPIYVCSMATLLLNNCCNNQPYVTFASDVTSIPETAFYGC